MQVVNDNHARGRAPAVGPGSDVIGGRGACALVDDVREVLTQFAAGLLVDCERSDHTGLQIRLATPVSTRCDKKTLKKLISMLHKTEKNTFSRTY